MARHTITVESAAALAAGANVCNVVAAAAANYKLRRCKLGIRTNTATVPTNQQITIAAFRATARGTQTTTVAPLAMDPRSVAPQSPGADTVWSVNPTLAANPLERITINTQAAIDVPWEAVEELICDQGTANGITFQNIGNAIPAGHLVVVSLEIEE